MSSLVLESSNGVCGDCGSEAESSKKECTSCDQKQEDGVCENSSCIINTTSAIDTISDDIDNINISDNNSSTDTTGCNNIPVCANCSKEGANNICNKCQSVKYCNAVCKKVHKKKHKKDCEEYVRLAAERAAELHDEKLFKQPPSPHGDCPICFLLLPSLPTGRKYKSCCGKVICSGCAHAPVYDDQGNEVDNRNCPFCRTSKPTKEEMIEMEMERVEMNDAHAIGKQGYHYAEGISGFPQDMDKALELYHRAGELGLSKAYGSIGDAYYSGRGVEVDKKKAMYYYELAAMKGSVFARSNLGIIEHRSGNMDRALRHYMIAVMAGDSDSLKYIKELYSDGHATKEDYTKALQSYQEYLVEIKSVQRDEAAAFSDRYRYY